MNINISSHFSAIKAFYYDFKLSAKIIGNAFASQCKANDESYLPDVAKDRNRNLKASASVQLAEKAETAKTQMRKELTAIRNDFAESVLEAPQKAFVDLLMIYHTTGIKLSRAEIEAFLTKAGGNYTSLKLIQGIARHSGYDVSFPDAAALDSDLQPVERMINNLDISLPAEAFDIAPETFVFNGVQWPVSTITLIANSTAAESLFKRFDEISDRWAMNTTPTVKDLATAAEALKTDAETLADIVQHNPEDLEVTEHTDPEAFVFSDPKAEKKAIEAQKHYFS